MSRLIWISSIAVAVFAASGTVFSILPGKDQPAAKPIAKVVPAAKRVQNPLRNRRVHLGKANKNGKRSGQRRTVAQSANRDHLPYEPGEFLVAKRAARFQSRSRLPRPNRYPKHPAQGPRHYPAASQAEQHGRGEVFHIHA